MNIEKHWREINFATQKAEEYRRRYYWKEWNSSPLYYSKSNDLIDADRIKQLALKGNDFALQFYNVIIHRDKNGKEIGREAKPKMSRHFMIEFYPCDNQMHNRAFESLIYDKNLAFSFAMHDKEFLLDVKKLNSYDFEVGNLKARKVHIHGVITFTSAKTFTAVANLLGIDCKFCLPCASLKNALLYLIHDGYANKSKYDRREACICSSHDTLFVEMLDYSRDIDMFDKLDEVDDYLQFQRKRVTLADKSFRHWLREHNCKIFLTDSTAKGNLKDLLTEHNRPYEEEIKDLRRRVNG